MCLSSMYVQNLLTAHAFVVVGLHSLPSVFDYFLVFPFFYDLPYSGTGLTWRWALLFFSPPFFLLPSPAIPLYYSYCEIVLPQSGWAFLGLPFIILLMAQYGQWFFYYITNGLLCPICFPLGIPGPFASVGSQVSLALFLTLHSHGLLLNSLGFSGPITLSLILEVHGLAINPLLSLLSLLWAYRDPFSLFHIIYRP